MPVVVEVVSQEKYSAWVGEQKKKMAARRRTTRTRVWTLDDLKARGAEDLRRQLRGLPPGERQGRDGGVPGPGRLEDRERAEGAENLAIVLNGKPARRWRRSASSCPIPILPR